MSRPKPIHPRPWTKQCLVVAVALLPLLCMLWAGGHGHDPLGVDDEECAVCDLQQAKWLPEAAGPASTPDSPSEIYDAVARERIALDPRHLLEPLRGPPGLA